MTASIRRPLDLVESGKRRVDVDKYYDIENYRPKVKSVLGLPMFLKKRNLPGGIWPGLMQMEQKVREFKRSVIKSFRAF